MKIRLTYVTARVICEHCGTIRSVNLLDADLLSDATSFSDLSDIIREYHPCPCLETAEPDWFDTAKEAELSQT